VVLNDEYFYDIAKAAIDKFVQYHPSYVKLDSVVKELMGYLRSRYRTKKEPFTEEEARVICRDRLLDIFRRWSKGSPLAAIAEDDDYDEYEDRAYMDEQFWIDVLEDYDGN